MQAKNHSAGERTTPRRLGYRMPAEWEPHRATWLAWPHNLETWPDQLELVKEIWVQMARALSPAEEVCLLVDDEREQEEAAGRLERAGVVMEHLSIYRIPTVDVWFRDYGPNFITGKAAEKGLAFIDWIFNAWGGKYESYVQDDRVASEMAGLLGLPVFQQEIVLEGGSIDVNGRGTCLTTEQCLLNPNRNPRLARKEIEMILADNLGVSRFIWLGDGIAGDDTDGHIDDIARFVNPTTIVCALEEDPKDENYRPLRENYERLQGVADQDSKKIDVVTIPMPGRVVYEGARLPASYANFYIANGVVLVPTYNHPNDRPALGILGDLFPGRKVLGIPCAALVAGLGAIHCVTQQEPSP
ncbi:MAG: agmatine deiminase family protein [Candidatus Binatota bacterium]